jgi:predicted anti-sigma-YlaC factor YlaD
MSGWTCDDVRERLDDFVDGQLADAGEGERVEAHLAACPGCRAEEAGLRALLAEAAALPAAVPPPVDLWPHIERRIRPSGAAAWPRYLAAAACVALAVAGALTARPTATPGAANVAGPAQVPGTLEPVALQAADVEQVERDYERAASVLLVKMRAEQARLSPETVAQVEESLRTIDAALGQIRAALQQRPAEPALHLMLAATHRKKVEVLRRVVEVGA